MANRSPPYLSAPTQGYSTLLHPQPRPLHNFRGPPVPSWNRALHTQGLANPNVPSWSIMNPTFYGAQEQRTGGRGGTLRPRAALVAGNVNSSLCAPHASLRLMFGILIALFCLGILIVVFVITSISTLRWIVFGLTFTVLILQVLNFVAEYY